MEDNSFTVHPNGTLGNTTPMQTPTSSFYVGDAPWQYSPPPIQHWPQQVPVQIVPSLTEERVQQIIDEVLRRVFNPEQFGLMDSSRFARVTITTDQGEQWRGVVYPVERTE